MTDHRICCFTGHRAIPYNIMRKLAVQLNETICRLAADGILTFRAGGAMGFDTLAALCVLELRQSLGGLRLDLILPCRDQTRLWPPNETEYYNYILNNCDSVRYISDIYTRDCMLERDRQLVRGSEVCVAYCTKSRGGAAYTMLYAMRQGVRVINLGDVCGIS
ncbi:MAG: SLOG family protein [Eubacteriales bacterium]|nr:SLOG family protein [Eubacteriales bacterium]